MKERKGDVASLCDILTVPAEVFYVQMQERADAWARERGTMIQQNLTVTQEKLPEWKQEMLACAERNYRGEHVLNGTNNQFLFVGNPPRWKERLVPDPEYVADLNRMRHWIRFIMAYYLTEEKKYAIKLKEELLDWIQECAPPQLDGMDVFHQCYTIVSPWKCIETGIRMFRSWPDAICFLMWAKLLDQEELLTIACSVYRQGELLRKVTPQVFGGADHNHYLIQMLGLLNITDLFPELQDAREWESFANGELIRCTENQLTEDGAQVEGCPHYHLNCMEHFCLWLALAKKRGLKLPEASLARIGKGLDYAFMARRPNGQCVPWGDSDVTDFAALLALLGHTAFGKKKWIAWLCEMGEPWEQIRGMTFENQTNLMRAGNIMLFDWNTAEWGLQKGEDGEPERSSLYSLQRGTGQAIFRSSWKQDGMHVFFGCRKLIFGQGRVNNHEHVALLSFDFTALGRPQVVDPGRFSYDEIEERRALKSPQMHNCLLLDDRPPIEYVSSWCYGPIEHDGCITDLQAQENCVWAQGLHTFYFPVIHSRLVAMVEDCFLVVWDKLTHLKGPHHVDLYFHLDSTEVRRGPSGFYTEHPGEANVYVHSLDNLEGSILPGYISEVYNVKRPSTRIRFEEAVTGAREYVTLVIPFLEKRSEVVLLSSFWEEDYSCRELCVNGKRYVIKWNGENFYVR